MAEYKVTITMTEIYSGYFEAESEEQAEKLALAAHEAGDLTCDVDALEVTVDEED